jgi:hypothetical protein
MWSVAIRIDGWHGVAADVRTQLVGEAKRPDPGSGSRAFVVGEVNGIADEREQIRVVAFQIGDDCRSRRPRPCR